MYWDVVNIGELSTGFDGKMRSEASQHIARTTRTVLLTMNPLTSRETGARGAFRGARVGTTPSTTRLARPSEFPVQVSGSVTNYSF